MGFSKAQAIPSHSIDWRQQKSEENSVGAVRFGPQAPYSYSTDLGLLYNATETSEFRKD
jgi:hypothetical protein